MRNIDDLEHFVLAEGETLILRTTRLLNMHQMQQLREHVERALPGRPVLVLPPDIEVRAGMLEVFGVDMTHMEEDVDACRKEITDAYEAGKKVMVFVDGEWFWVHHLANPFDLASITDPRFVRLSRPGEVAQKYC